MNVGLMMNEILGIANAVICKPALPDFGLAPDQRSERMRVSALNQLDGAFDRYLLGGSK